MCLLRNVLSLSILLTLCIFSAENSWAQEEDEPRPEKGQLLEAPEIEYEQKRIEGLSKSKSTDVVYEGGFETDTSGWTTEGVWAIGVPSSGPGSGFESSNAGATNLSGEYSNNSDDRLISPSISLPQVSSSEDILLHVREWFEIESGVDEGKIEISTDGGSTWTQVSSRSGSSGWRDVKINLTPYTGQDIKLAFHFISDESNTFSGWYVDDIQFTVDTTDPLSAKITSINSQQFPFVFSNVAVDTSGTGIPSLTRSNFTVFENGVQQTENFEVTPPEEGGGTRRVDVVFLMDNSGSMDDEQNAVRNNMIAFVDSLSASGVDFALGLCRFGSADDDGTPILEDNGSLTTDPLYFKNDVWSRNTVDGTFEPGWDALHESATGFSFRPGAQRVFILITDESVTGNNNEGTYTKSETEQTLLDQSVTNYALIDSTDQSSRQDYGNLAETTGGAYFDITSPFQSILDEIGTTVANSYVLSYRSTDDQVDGTERTVRVEVTYGGNTARDTTSYVAGGVPQITRTQETRRLENQTWAEGTEFTIGANIKDDVAPFVQEATVFYRSTSDSTSAYQSVAMSAASDSLYQATIPVSAASPPGLDYYITATDGEATSSLPSVDPTNNPYQIAILPNEPPEIDHTPVTDLTTGSPIPVSATIVDSTNSLVSTTLYYRQVGDLNYATTEMTNVSGDVYEAEIPGTAVTEDGVQYYIEATDDFDVRSTAGTADQPIEITVSGSPIEEIEIGPLALTADQIQKVGEGIYEASGNVSLEGILSLSGTVTANVNTLTIQGDSGVGVIPGPVDQIYNGSYELSLVEEGSTFLEGVNLPGNSTLQVSGLDVEISGIELLTGDSGPGIRVEGKLVLPEILDGTRAEVSQVQVTANDGLDLAGEVGLNKPVPLRAATLNELSLSFNTVDEPSRFAAKAGLETRLFNVMGGGVLLGGRLDSLGFSVEPGNPIPIASTGMALSRGGGRVDNLASDENIVLGVSVDIVPSAGPASDVVKLRELSLEYEFGERIEGSGNVDVFEQNVASASVRAERDLVGFNGQFGIGQSIPRVQQDIISSELSATVTERCYGAELCSNPPLRMNGSMEAAARIPALGGGFPFDWLSTVASLPYQGPSTQNSLTAKPLKEEGEFRGETRLEVCWDPDIWGIDEKCIGKGVAYGIAYNGDDSDPLSADFARNSQNLNLKLFPKAALKIRKAAQRENRFEGKSLIVGSGSSNSLLKAENDTLRQGFTLREERSSIIVRVEGESTTPEYSVTGPSGTLTPENPESAFSSGAVFNQLEAENKAFFLVTDPTPGEWSVNLPDDGTEYAVDIIGEDPAPALDMEEPSRSGGSAELNWEVSDPTDEVSVDLYADTDQSGQDGILIAEDVSSEQTSLSWSLGEVPTGTYYVYAVAEDGKNPPVVDYATEPIQVVTTGAPSAPTGVTLTPSDTALTASWNGNDEAARYIVYYEVGEDPTFGSQEIGVGDSRIDLSLAPGRTYHAAVTALDSSGQESELSEVETVTYESQTQNNVPVITTTDPVGVAQEGERYRQPIKAEDADGDPLSYELATGPEGMSVGENGKITWAPEPGSYSAKVRVTDPAGGADSLRWQIRAFDREGATARLSLSRSSYVGEQAGGQLLLIDPEASQADSINSKRVVVQSNAAPEGLELILQETQTTSGRFRASFELGSSSEEEPLLNVEEVDTLSIAYEDQFPDTTVTANALFYAEQPPRFSPELLAPVQRAEDATTFPTLTWRDLEGVRKYRVQVSTDSSFQSIVREQVVSSSSLSIEGLEKGSGYFWRVRGETVVEGPWSDLHAFTTRPAELQAAVSRTFGDASEPSDYRLVALPGAADRPIGSAIDGEPGLDWQAYWDDGTSDNYLREYDSSSMFSFRSGRGFWVTSTDTWSFDERIEAVDLKADATYPIALHEGWNIISNPFLKDVDWNYLRALNSDSLRALWRFDGAFTRTDTFASARTGEAFYFLNDHGLDSLAVPFPSTASPDTAGKKGDADRLALTAKIPSSGGPVSKVQMDLSTESEEGIDDEDVIAPPSRFSSVSLRINPTEEVPSRKRLLAVESRPPPAEGEGTMFNLQLQTERENPIRLSASGLESIGNYEIALLNRSAGRSYDLRSDQTVTLQRVDSTALQLAVGSASFVEDQRQLVTPDEVELTTYPNPLRTQATVEYALPEAKNVRLAVYDILGRQVAVLENGRKEAGRHRVTLQSDQLSSGVYFGRLEVGNQTRTQKITVVR